MAECKMTYRPLGRCGTRVSAFGLGGWTTYGGSVTALDDVRRIMIAAFEAGINFFDTADVYEAGEAERVMGKVLAELPRNELVISSKCFFPMSDNVNDRGLSRKHIMESIDRTLRNLGTDYLDIYFCHRFDTYTPIEETACAMDDLVHQGKILYWGTSEWHGDQLRVMHELCKRRSLYAPQVEQPQYSLLARKKLEQSVRPATDELGMGMVMWSPLRSGLLSGKYDDGIPSDSRLARIDWLREEVHTEERVELVRRFKSIAERAGCSRTQLALAWVAAQPGVSSVILGAASEEQLAENLGSLAVSITEDLSAALDELFPSDRMK